jgi:hypothetical protein
MTEKDVEQVAEFLHRVVQISLTTQKEAGTKLLKDFTKTFESGSGEAPKLIAELKKDVMKFATSFPLPGIPDTVSYSSNSNLRCDRVLINSPRSSGPRVLTFKRLR